MYSNIKRKRKKKGRMRKGIGCDCDEIESGVFRHMAGARAVFILRRLR